MLFNLYINNVIQAFLHCNVLTFANDLEIYKDHNQGIVYSTNRIRIVSITGAKPIFQHHKMLLHVFFSQNIRQNKVNGSSLSICNIINELEDQFRQEVKFCNT